MFPVHLQRPAPILRRYVQFYTQRELSLRDPLVVQSVPARAAPMFEFIFGDPIRIRYPGSPVEERSPRAVVVGMLTRPHGELRLQGTLTSFVIMFHPTGLSALFPVDLGELTDRDFDAHCVAGKPIAELEERLANCDSFTSRASVADAFLARRVPDYPKTDGLSSAIGSILAQDGRVKIPELAAHSGISNRQFERTFRARYGMRPKLYARIVRFQSALDSKARSSTKSWTDVAHEFGYHDQMHMVHDFEEFTGATPTETLRLLEMFFRQQLEAIRIGAERQNSRPLPRFVI
jgi:methylphosphotriester-DNA--protein-cysteine methyltransferase